MDANGKDTIIMEGVILEIVTIMKIQCMSQMVIPVWCSVIPVIWKMKTVDACIVIQEVTKIYYNIIFLLNCAHIQIIKLFYDYLRFESNIFGSVQSYVSKKLFRWRSICLWSICWSIQTLYKSMYIVEGKLSIWSL